MDFKIGIGSLSCRMCGAAYQMNIHHLHEPIDVFSEWLDDCEAAEKANGVAAAAEAGSAAYRGRRGDEYDEYDEEEDDDDLLAPSGLKSKGTRKGSAIDDEAAVGDEDSDDE